MNLHRDLNNFGITIFYSQHYSTKIQLANISNIKFKIYNSNLSQNVPSEQDKIKAKKSCGIDALAK
jgi:hypothetical protein